MASGNPTQIHRLTVLQSPEEKEHNNDNVQLNKSNKK